ncbi:hypothetical protein LCGC14_0484640 [marine sediment metagenome]|uniref:Uncharacterized protein n=1 Tax=marine sediment metagenome TaxID=412755 RepID=A0A0F9S8B7_9ZZZZ|nr:rRNA maturation RNase YbeY [Actinomycetota bacterium]
MEIIVSDRQNSKINIDLIEDLSDHCLSRLNAAADTELSMSLVLADEISQLNLRYRKQDKPTDVLSFSYKEEPQIIKLLGDIVLCPEQAQKKAKENERDFDEYFALLIAHSILHLFGYSHDDDDDAKVMSEKEQQLLKSFDFGNRSFK